MEEINTNGAVQQNDGQLQQQGQEPKTFTQEEVNRIVQERLARAKTAAGPSDKELELQQREDAVYIRERVAEMGLPDELRDSLKGLEKETADKCIQIVTPYIKKASEPICNAIGPTTDPAVDSVRAAMGLK